MKSLSKCRVSFSIVRGMVLKVDAMGTIKRLEKAKVIVFAGGVNTSATETERTVLICSIDSQRFMQKK